MGEKFSNKQAEAAVKSGYSAAEEMLKDSDKVEKFLQDLEAKLSRFPIGGEKLAEVPLLISLVRSYVKKEYKDVPIGTIVAIVSALIYLANPADAIPDIIPGVGLADDAAVIMFCVKMIEWDLNEYKIWRQNR